MQSKKTQERIRIVLLNESFQKDVIKFRKKWNINPTEMNDLDKNEEWWRQFLAQEKEYISTKRKEGKEIIEKEIPINAFHLDIQHILKTYHLPLAYSDSLKGHLLFDVVSPTSPVTIQVTLDKNDGTHKNFAIGITVDTTLEDVINYWPSIKQYQQTIFGYKKGRGSTGGTNIDRDSKILLLHREGKSYKEIMSIINEGQKNKLSYNEIAMIISRLKEKIAINT
ncbi:MAG: hypothetical protein KBC17_03190 [Candidatus Pacebacteria bacterium]|nr:hypothetical protein [Candidatus Paceibacterota bacterium]